MGTSKLVSILKDTLRKHGWEPGAFADWDEDLTDENYGKIIAAGFYRDTLPLLERHRRQWDMLKTVETKEREQWSRMMQMIGVK